MKKITSFLIALLVSLQLHATIHTVTSPSDDKLTPTEGMLRYYIENAGSGDTIIFAVDNVVLDTTLRINGGKITIDGGNGVQIDVNNNGRVFNISCYTYDNITLRNLIIQNGHIENSSAMGGGMYAYVFGGTLLVDGCTFKNNSVVSDGDGQGGALRTNGGVFQNCRFLNNEVSGTGYAIGGGGIFAVGGEFINCIVAGNSSNYGGGIYASNAKFINCTVSQNTASTAGNGAGISCENNCEFYNCIVYNNKSGATEDNVDNSGGTFSNSAFESGNSLVGTNNNIGLTTTPFTHSGTDSLSLYKSSECVDKGSTSNITVPGTDIIGNSRISGSAIDIGAYEFVSLLSVTRTDDNKTAPKLGMLRYAIENANSGDTITFEVDTVFADTTFTFGTQSLFIIGKDDNNVIIKGDKSFTLFYIHVKVDNIKIGLQNLTFTDGGDTYGGLCGLFSSNPGSFVKHCSFIDNIGTLSGGAYLRNGEVYDCRFNNNKILGNSCGTGGLTAGGTIIKNTDFTNNGSFDDESTVRYGGLDATNCEILDCKFVNNDANCTQGAAGANVWNSNLTNCYFYKNHVAQDAESYAGGVNSTNSNFVNCTFKENIGAVLPDMGFSVPKYSGGASATGGSFINCLFVGNKGKYAGGLYSGSSSDTNLHFNLINCTFTGNSAYSGDNNATGGFILFGDYFSQTGITTIVKNTISYGNFPNNQYSENDNVTVSFCAIQDTLLVGTGNIRLDESPFHSLLAEDNYLLKENSVCINAGDTVDISKILPDEDILANSRINNDTIDIGAVEYNERILPSVTFPTSTQIMYGDSTGEAINNDGSADIPGSFVFNESIYPQVGQEKIWVEFSPTSDSIIKYKSVGDSIVIDVAKAILSVQVGDTTITYGDVEPFYKLLYDGFVFEENSDVIDERPVASVSDYDLLDAGSYPDTIIASGGVDNNYDFIYQPAALTINKATITVTAQDTTVEFGATEPTYELVYDGFVKDEDVTVLDNKPIASVSNYQSLNAGVYTDAIVVSGGEDNNYDFIYENGTLTIVVASSAANLNIADIGIYPNPAVNKITIENVDEGTPFTLFSFSGTIVKEGIIDGTKNTIDVSNQPTGVYILSIQYKSSVSNYKIVKKAN